MLAFFSFSSPPSRPVSAVPSRRVHTTWLLPANEPKFPWVSLSLPSPGHKLRLVCPKCLRGHFPRHQTHCSPWGEASEDQEHSATTVTGTERELSSEQQWRRGITQGGPRRSHGMTFSQGKLQHNTKENVLTLRRGGHGRASTGS